MTSAKDVTRQVLPHGFLMRNDKCRYSTFTWTCSGLANTPSASSSSNFACTSSSLSWL